jgi:hypothetical protein
MTVEFDEAAPTGPSRPPERPSFFTGLVLKTGLVKTAKGAQVVILILALLLLAATVFQFKQANIQAPFPTPEQVAL